LDKYKEVLFETSRVQSDLGWPPLVTPTSQIVGVQATMNVVFGRYKRVTKETKDYVRGMYGRPPAEIRDEVKEQILGPNWRDEEIRGRPADLIQPQYNALRDEMEAKGLSSSPEWIISYAMFPAQTEEFLRGKARPEFVSSQLPLELGSGERRFKTKVDGVEYNMILQKVKGATGGG